MCVCAYVCSFKCARTRSTSQGVKVVLNCEAMSKLQGFQPRAPCPMWLLDVPTATIVPLARGTQTNPIYAHPPGSGTGDKLVLHCADNVLATGCGCVHAYGMDWIYARVSLPPSMIEGYINIWTGRSLTGPGTLYCSLVQEPSCSGCLCGRCRTEWMHNGWKCPFMQW